MRLAPIWVHATIYFIYQTVFDQVFTYLLRVTKCTYLLEVERNSMIKSWYSILKCFVSLFTKIAWILQGTDPPGETTTTAPSGDEPQTDAGIVQLASGSLMMFAIFVL